MRRRLLYALLFIAWTAEPPVERTTVLYSGLWRSPFKLAGPLFVSIPGLGLFGWQVLLLLLAPACLLARGAFRRREGRMDAAILAGAASIAVTLGWGWLRGGSLYRAYYQVWPFLATLMVGLLLPAVVRTPRHLKGLGLTILLAAVTRAALATYFFWAVVHDRVHPTPSYMTTHDDSLLFVAGLLVVLSWAFVRRTFLAWSAAAAIGAGLLYAMVLNNRRLVWIELLLAAAALHFALPRGRVKRRVNRALLVAAPALAAYVAIGLDRPEAAFAPLRALSTAGSYGDNSSLAREEEIRNLIFTLTDANPLLGTGWGMPYQKYTSVFANFDATWENYLYQPHNSLLAVAVFGGLVGLAGVWLVVPVAAQLCSRVLGASVGEVERASAMTAAALLPAYAAQCYGDIGFESLTCGLLLGSALGAASAVSAWSAARPRRPASLPAAPRLVAARGPRRFVGEERAMRASRMVAMIEACPDGDGGVPVALIRATYRASREGRMALLLNGLTPAQADRALDRIVPVLDGVAGVVYCTPASLEQVLGESGWPGVAFLETDTLAALLARRGVRVLSAAQALPALGRWSAEAVQEVAS